MTTTNNLLDLLTEIRENGDYALDDWLDNGRDTVLIKQGTHELEFKIDNPDLDTVWYMDDKINTHSVTVEWEHTVELTNDDHMFMVSILPHDEENVYVYHEATDSVAKVRIDILLELITRAATGE